MKPGSNKAALVTGTTGFIGSHLVEFLQAKGWNLVATYREREANPPVQLSNLRFVPCDLRNGRQVNRLFQRTEFTHVFHLGAQSLPTLSWMDPVSTFESNIMGSLNSFEAIPRIKRPPVVVSACSGAEYGHVQPSAIPVTEKHALKPLHASARCA